MTFKEAKTLLGWDYVIRPKQSVQIVNKFCGDLKYETTFRVLL